MGKANEYLEFELLGSTGKTKTWTVLATRSNDTLGYVHWRSGWRRYVFSPLPSTDYEQDCMRTIADFIESETAKQRAGWKGAKL